MFKFIVDVIGNFNPNLSKTVAWANITKWGVALPVLLSGLAQLLGVDFDAMAFTEALALSMESVQAAVIVVRDAALAIAALLATLSPFVTREARLRNPGTVDEEGRRL